MSLFDEFLKGRVSFRCWSESEMEGLRDLMEERGVPCDNMTVFDVAMRDHSEGTEFVYAPRQDDAIMHFNPASSPLKKYYPWVEAHDFEEVSWEECGMVKFDVDSFLSMLAGGVK